MPKKCFLPNKLKPWIEARKKYHLSHAQIQMARELGLNPKKFGSMANNKQEPWKAPLPEYIESLYEKRFSKPMPKNVNSLEVMDAKKRKRKAERKAKKNKPQSPKERNRLKSHNNGIERDLRAARFSEVLSR